MNRFYYWIIAVNLAVVNGAAGKEEPLVQQIRSAVQHEAFTVNALVQSGFRYSLGDDNFQGGRIFEAANARLSFRGNLDGGFFTGCFSIWSRSRTCWMPISATASAMLCVLPPEP